MTKEPKCSNDEIAVRGQRSEGRQEGWIGRSAGRCYINAVPPPCFPRAGQPLAQPSCPRDGTDSLRRACGVNPESFRGCYSQSCGYGGFCGVALGVAAREGGVRPAARSEGFAVPEGETFAMALGAALTGGALPGEPVAGAGDAAGAAVGIAISSRRKLLSLELRCA